MSDEQTDIDARPISRRQAAWLDAQASAWVGRGLIAPETRAQILASYTTEAAEHRSMLALMVLGALMLGIGVLLLIGYNWSAIPAYGKVGILIASVAAAFAGSAAAFARKQQLTGEIVALVGVLLFGNAIWLIGQVLHMQGSFADAFMWWAIGAIATTALVRSSITGAAAAMLLVCWAFTPLVPGETDLLVMFGIAWCTTVLLAYRLRSTVMVRIAVVAGVTWACTFGHFGGRELIAIGAAAIAACAMYALGAWHRESSPFGRAWQDAALAMLALTFIPLLTMETHEFGGSSGGWQALVQPFVLLPIAVSPLLRWGSRPMGLGSAHASDAIVGVVAAATAVWLTLVTAGHGASWAWDLVAVFSFSMLTLALAVALIRRALRSGRLTDLVFGVAFALEFLLIRWVSLVDNMLLSGAMLILASLGFFLVARLWRSRPKPAATLEPVGGRA